MIGGKQVTLRIVLEPYEWQILMERSMVERRTPADMAAYLVVKGLGLLEPQLDKNDSDPA